MLPDVEGGQLDVLDELVGLESNTLQKRVSVEVLVFLVVDVEGVNLFRDDLCHLVIIWIVFTIHEFSSQRTLVGGVFLGFLLLLLNQHL